MLNIVETEVLGVSSCNNDASVDGILQSVEVFINLIFVSLYKIRLSPASLDVPLDIDCSSYIGGVKVPEVDLAIHGGNCDFS